MRRWEAEKEADWREEASSRERKMEDKYKLGRRDRFSRGGRRKGG